MLATLTILLAQASGQVLIPDAVLSQDGSFQQGWGVRIENGTITDVGPENLQREGDEVFRLQGLLTPGLIDAFTNVGVDGQAIENTRPLTPELRVADSLDLSSEQWSAFLHAGVTAVHILPEPENVVSGWSSVVVLGEESARVYKEQARPLVSLLESEVTDRRLGPSSLAGALDLLRAGLDADLVAANPVVAIADAESLRNAKPLLSNASFLSSGDLADYGALLGQMLVAVPPLQDRWSSRLPETLKAAGKHEIRPAFGSGFVSSSPPHTLRQSAMTWARFARNPQAAILGLTQSAAQFAGVDQVMGSITSGKRADLVLWSAHPLDATARVKAVMVGGKTIYRAQPQTEEDSP